MEKTGRKVVEEIYREDGSAGQRDTTDGRLAILKIHMYNESDAMIVQKFVENPYYQYFCGNEYFEHSLPIDPSSMTRFRKLIGKKSIEELFRETVSSAAIAKELKEKDFEQLNVDTTVQEKAISFPTDAKLYYKMLEVLVI